MQYDSKNNLDLVKQEAIVSAVNKCVAYGPNVITKGLREFVNCSLHHILFLFFLSFFLTGKIILHEYTLSNHENDPPSILCQ
ncbi:unnamed protein product [Rhizophagus irregularis]|nr:unnamed protein product [Rhizophagus irregularis]CAB5369784.1 unnamed protein product [Rhizophagus irregularis]